MTDNRSAEKHISPEVKAQWLEALRSGKYKQGSQGWLSGDKYCCLAVLAHNQRGRVYANCQLVDDDPGASQYVSQLGVGGDVFSRLVNMNDSGKSFAEIADWIEANL